MSKFEDLIKLQKMLEKGLLTQPEFERLKPELLASAESADVAQMVSGSPDGFLDGGAAVGAKAQSEIAQPDSSKRKYLTKGEWFLTISGWVLMSAGFFLTLVLGVMLIGAKATAGMSSQALCWLSAAMLFVGAQLSSIGWLLGVDRGFGGVRTVVFIITVVWVGISTCMLGAFCSLLQ